MKTNIIAALLLAISIAFSGFFIARAIVYNKDFDRYVAVKGLAEKLVKSDKAIWRINYSYAANNLTEVYSGLAHAQKEIINFLLQQGFIEENISIQPGSVIDNQSINYSANQNIKHFTATATIILATKKVDAVYQAIQKIGNLVNKNVVINDSYVRYIFTDLNMIKPEMLNASIHNAKEAANTFAKNSGSKLTGIRMANQGVFTINAADNAVNPDTAIMKSIRVVTSVEYFLQ